MTTVVFTELAFQEAFNALLERQHRTAMELRHERHELKRWELVQLLESREGIASALDSMQAARRTQEAHQPSLCPNCGAEGWHEAPEDCDRG